jgi:outer membrane receptor for ferrienterochelin and colicins
LFAEDEWAMTESFTLTGGLRMDKDENYGTNWTPRGYGVWHLADQWTLKAAFRRATVRRTCVSRLPTGDR